MYIQLNFAYALEMEQDLIHWNTSHYDWKITLRGPLPILAQKINFRFY